MPKQRRSLSVVILAACERAAKVLVDEPPRPNPGKINDWPPVALASWIAPTVERAVRRHFTIPAKPKRKPKP